MISVPVTPQNQEIYQELLVLDKDFQKCTDDVERDAIIKMANALCEKLELGDFNGRIKNM